MKILLVLEAALGGSGRHVIDLADGLLARRHEVTVIYSPLRADRAFLRGIAGLRTMWPDFVCTSIPITREVTFSDISSYLSLSRYLRANGPFDVIHAHSTKAGFLARLLVRTQGATMIYTPHGLMTLDPDLIGLPRRAVCILESMLALRSDTVICVSSGEHLCAVETGIRPAKLVLIPNGIWQCVAGPDALQRKEVRASLGATAETVLIGYVGRFCGQKKPERVIEAFALLKQRTAKPARLVMIGWGPLEDRLRRQATELKLTDHVSFLGQTDAGKYMPAFDVLAHTAVFEAFAYVFVEALSAGVPVVTMRVGAADELISNGVTGYVCDPWEPSAFAEYLKLLVEDSRLRSAMSAGARERAAQYSVDRMVDSVAELYLHLSARPHLATEISANQQTL